MKLYDLALWIRDNYGPNDEKEAVRQIEAAEGERERLERARLDAPAHASARHAQSRRSTIAMGTSMRSDGTPYTVLLPESDVRGGGHRLITGATGSGKSYLVLSTLMQLIRKQSRGIIVIDMKGELAQMLRNTFLPSLVSSLPQPDAVELLSRIAVIAPFDERATTPFQMLVREPSLPIEIQAHEVATSFGRTIGNDLGVLQQHVLRNALTLAIDVGLTFPDVAELLRNRDLLRGALARTRLPDIKSYFTSQFTKERAGSVTGLLSRLDSLVMVPSLRRMLTSPGMVRFDRLLEETVTIIDLGGAPAGLSELARFFGQILFGKLVRAVFTRTVNDRTKPVVIVADEFQQLLMPEVAREFERILTLARSQKVFLWAMFQQAAQVEAASPALLRILRTNTNYQILMRSDLDDAKHFAHVLPVTGSIAREATGFPDLRTPVQNVPADEERRKLLERVPSLPDRLFWFWDRRSQYPAQLVRSPSIDVPASTAAAERLPVDVRAMIRNGVLALSPEVVEREGQRRREYRDQMAASASERTRATNPLGETPGVSRPSDMSPILDQPPSPAQESGPVSVTAAGSENDSQVPQVEFERPQGVPNGPGNRRRRGRGVDLG